MKKYLSLIITLIVTATISLGCANTKTDGTSNTSDIKPNVQKMEVTAPAANQVSKDLLGKELWIKGNKLEGGKKYKFETGEYKLSVKSTHENKEDMTLDVISNIEVEEITQETYSGLKVKITFNMDIKVLYKQYEGIEWKLVTVEKANSEEVNVVEKKMVPELKLQKEDIKKIIFSDKFVLGKKDLDKDGLLDAFQCDENSLKSFEVVDIKNVPSNDYIKQVIVKINLEGQDPWRASPKKIWKGQGNLIIDYRLIPVDIEYQWHGYIMSDISSFTYSVEM